MKVLGIDPSLTAYGWAIHETDEPVGSRGRCPSRGRFSTPAKMEFVERYISMRESLRTLIQIEKPDFIGIEHPVFAASYSEGMYGLFLYSCEALKLECSDVVFWTPLQAKAHAREKIPRSATWKMDKQDMVEAAKADAGPGKWNHNEADAYHIAVLSARFWMFYEGLLDPTNLTPVEAKYFSTVHTYSRGKNAGRTVKSGMVHRENDRFFLWSNLAKP